MSLALKFINHTLLNGSYWIDFFNGVPKLNWYFFYQCAHVWSRQYREIREPVLGGIGCPNTVHRAGGTKYYNENV